MDQPTSKEPRGPVSLRIKFRSANLDQFIERYAVDVSRGGIFIRTREPLPVGTQLRFDFQLQDAAPLLAGEGTIVWIRENDPTRAGVTPGMGVRFDKLTAASQPVLEKILAEKARREQAGAPSKTGPAGGMAVRRPSSTFSALDPASARAAQAASGPPRVGGLSPLGAQPRVPLATGSAPLGAQPRATAPAAGSGPSPLGAQPRATAPAVSSDPFGTRSGAPTAGAPRTGETAVPGGGPPLESSGAFGRPRSTTGMNAQRPAPAPSALFEKPTADDIDRALAVLTEVDGPTPAPVSVPNDFSSRIRRPTDAQPTVLEATPDVGDAPKAAHRRPTDAQPMVLESTPDVGDAPPRRSGTRPLFSGTGEMKIPTVPVAPLGETADSSLLEEHDREDEDDATSAWIGSGPTRVGGSEPELPVAAVDAKSSDAKAAATANAQLPPPAPAPSLDASVLPSAAAPKLMAPDFAAAVIPPSTKSTKSTRKKGSGATMAIVAVLLLAGGGGAYYSLKGPGRSVLSGAAPAPAAAPAPEATVPATAVDVTAPSAQASSDATAAVAAAPTRAEKPGEAKPSEAKSGEAKSGEAKSGEAKSGEAKSGEAKSGEAKTEGTAGEAKPTEAKSTEEKPSEAKAEAKPSEGKSGGHRGRRHGGGASAEAAAAPAVADVSPKPAGDAPSGDAPAKAASSGHVLKVSSSPAGAEVIVDGTSMGSTPLSSGDVDPALPHSITIKKDGFEAYEHMIGGSDWPRAKNGVRTLRLNAKLRSMGGDSAKPAETDTPSEPPPGLGTTPASPKRE